MFGEQAISHFSESLWAPPTLMIDAIFAGEAQIPGRIPRTAKEEDKEEEEEAAAVKCY